MTSSVTRPRGHRVVFNSGVLCSRLSPGRPGSRLSTFVKGNEGAARTPRPRSHISTLLARQRAASICSSAGN